MKKSELKIGYVAIRNDGARGIVAPFYNERLGRESLIISFGHLEWCGLDMYDETLHHKHSKHKNIDVVCGLSSDPESVLDYYIFESRPFLWSRSVSKIIERRNNNDL